MHFVFMAATAALGGLLFGYDTGVISGALLFIREVFALSSTMQGVVAAIALGGAAVGAAFAGSLADRLGRKMVILGTGVLFMAGALISAAATGTFVLLAGRLLVGVAIGISSMLTPLYLAELAPAERRGAMVSLNQLFLTIGILVSYLAGYALAETAEGWRWMLGLGALPGLILFCGMLLLPESPRWLASKGRMGEAEAAIRRLRGSGDARAEIAHLRDAAAGEGAGGEAGAIGWTALAAPRVRRVLAIGVGLAIFQQVTGINTVIYFAPTIFQSAGLNSASAAILATAGLGAVNVLLTFVAIGLIDRAGRRALLLWGLAGMAATLCVLAGGFALGAGGALGWIVALSLAGYVACFAIGLGPVFWLLISEIFPLAVRGRAMGIATVANWVFNLLVTLTFLDLIAWAGQIGTFLLYAAATLVALLFTWRCVPETRGRSLEEIEAALR